MSIGKRIKKVRGSLTREEFASKIGANKSTVQRYELQNAIPKGDVLCRMKEGFGISIDWLLSGEGNMFGQGDVIQISNVNDLDPVACAEERSILDSPDKGFGYTVSMIKEVFDTDNKRMIGQAIAAVAVVHDLAKGRERLDTLEECIGEIKKNLPPADTEERRSLWQKLKVAGMIDR